MKNKTKYTAILWGWIAITIASVLLANLYFPYTLISAGIGGYQWGKYIVKLRAL